MINLKNLKIKIINDLVDRLYNILWELDCVRFVELGLGGFLVNEFNELKNSIECEIKYILSTNNDFWYDDFNNNLENLENYEFELEYSWGSKSFIIKKFKKFNNDNDNDKWLVKKSFKKFDQLINFIFFE